MNFSNHARVLACSAGKCVYVNQLYLSANGAQQYVLDVAARLNLFELLVRRGIIAVPACYTLLLRVLTQLIIINQVIVTIAKIHGVRSSLLYIGNNSKQATAVVVLRAKVPTHPPLLFANAVPHIPYTFCCTFSTPPPPLKGVITTLERKKSSQVTGTAGGLVTTSPRGVLFVVPYIHRL